MDCIKPRCAEESTHLYWFTLGVVIMEESAGVSSVEAGDQSMQLLTLSHAHGDQRAGKESYPFLCTVTCSG